MANIQNELNNIKTALYGKDVRNSIHDGIDAINNEVESTTGRQVDLENTFDQLIINAGNSNAEIVDARVKNDGTSYSKLGDRLNEVDSQLEHIENYNNNKVNAKYPPHGYEGIVEGEDIYDKFIKLIQDFDYIYIPGGSYYISKTIEVRENQTIEFDKNAIIYITENVHFLKLTNNCKIVGGMFSTPSKHNCGVIYLTGIATYNEVKDVRIGQNTSGNIDPEIGTTIGIYFDATDKNGNANNCYQMFNRFENIRVDWCGYVFKYDGIKDSGTWATANEFTNITTWHTHQIVDCGKGIGGNLFTNIRTQCGPKDKLLYNINGELNSFKNLIYYDLPAECVIAKFNEDSRVNYFELWFEKEAGFKPLTEDYGNKNRIVKPGSTTPTIEKANLEGDWVGKGSRGVEYYKQNGEVVIRGGAEGGSFGSTIFTLPPGYRPSFDQIFVCSSGSYDYAIVIIHAANGVVLSRRLGSENEINFNGIRFRVDI